MNRYLLVLVLFIGLSATVNAVGVVQVPDMSVSVANPIDVTFTLSSGEAQATYEFYLYMSPIVVNNGAVLFEGSEYYNKTLTMGGFEKKIVTVKIDGRKPGEYTLAYTLVERGSSMFQSKVADTFKFKVVGDAPVTNSTTPGGGGSSHSGGGGGGGGYIPSKTGTTTTTTAPPSSQPSVQSPPQNTVQPSQFAPVGSDVNGVDQSKSGAQNPVVAAVNTNEGSVSSKTKSWGLIAIGIGIVMIALQVALVVAVKRKGES